MSKKLEMFKLTQILSVQFLYFIFIFIIVLLTVSIFLVGKDKKQQTKIYFFLQN